jgi:hypothetical protein
MEKQDRAQAAEQNSFPSCLRRSASSQFVGVGSVGNRWEARIAVMQNKANFQSLSAQSQGPDYAKQSQFAGGPNEG